MWISDAEFEAYHKAKADNRRGYIRRIMGEKRLRPYTVAKGTGISTSVVRRFLNGGDINTRTYDKIRLFVDKAERPVTR